MFGFFKDILCSLIWIGFFQVINRFTGRKKKTKKLKQVSHFSDSKGHKQSELHEMEIPKI